MSSILAVVAVCAGTVTFSSRPASAASVAADRARATVIYRQIQTINARVERLGQKYDEAHVKLQNMNNQIKNTKNVVAAIERSVARGNKQLRQDAVFAYVTNGSAINNNPLFAKKGSDIGATNVYNQLAEGNVSITLSHLKNYKIQLTQERSVLKGELQQAGDATRTAAGSFHDAMVLQASLKNTLNQVKGQIASFVTQVAAQAAATSVTILQAATPSSSFPAPPPNSRADIAVRAAMSFLGVPYVWGGASRSGVDCSGLIMLAYEAAGVNLPHYSGAQYADTVRVPLSDIQPGDLLFYGYNGDEHVAMYVGNGQMIEAETTGTNVLITPIRLGYGFVGLGRPRS